MAFNPGGAPKRDPGPLTMRADQVAAQALQKLRAEDRPGKVLRDFAEGKEGDPRSQAHAKMVFENEEKILKYRNAASAISKILDVLKRGGKREDVDASVAQIVSGVNLEGNDLAALQAASRKRDKRALVELRDDLERREGPMLRMLSARKYTFYLQALKCNNRAGMLMQTPEQIAAEATRTQDDGRRTALMVADAAHELEPGISVLCAHAIDNVANPAEITGEDPNIPSAVDAIEWIKKYGYALDAAQNLQPIAPAVSGAQRALGEFARHYGLAGIVADAVRGYPAAGVGWPGYGTLVSLASAYLSKGAVSDPDGKNPVPGYRKAGARMMFHFADRIGVSDGDLEKLKAAMKTGKLDVALQNPSIQVVIRDYMVWYMLEAFRKRTEGQRDPLLSQQLKAATNQIEGTVKQEQRDEDLINMVREMLKVAGVSEMKLAVKKKFGRI